MLAGRPGRLEPPPSPPPDVSAGSSGVRLVVPRGRRLGRSRSRTLGAARPGATSPLRYPTGGAGAR